MRIILFIIALFLTFYNCQDLSLAELDGISLYARRFEACRELNPTIRCFKGNVKLSVSYDQTSIKYFKFTGEQVANNFDGTLVVFPTKHRSTLKQVKGCSFSVIDLQGIYSYSFLQATENIQKITKLKQKLSQIQKHKVKKDYINQYFMYNKVISNIQPDPSQIPENPKNQSTS
ncbi:hypothetical protein ABPG72_011449 [Tetrahymena utriculariae]